MKLIKLEALRGAAALYVLLHHTISDLTVSGVHIGLIFSFGQEAVILFFLLSGFVIHYSFNFSKDKSFKIFFLKRFTRIYIPLFFVFAMTYIVLSWRYGGLIDAHFKELLFNILMLQDIPSLKPNVITAPYLDDAPLWSLSYEWWFYMAYFIIFQLSLKYVKNVDLFVFLTSVVFSVFYIYYPNIITRIGMYFSIWWTGVYLSKILIEDKKFSFGNLKVPLIFLASIICLLILNLYLKADQFTRVGLYPFLELRHFVFAFIAVVIAVIWKRFHWIYFDKIFAPFIIFAPISYVLYISHYPLIVGTHQFDFLFHNKTIGIIFGIAISFIFAYIVEIRIYPVVRKGIMRIFLKKLN
ncbi:acyltransferase family protein [Hydrogenimonas sp.]